MQVRRALLAVAARQPVGRSRNPTEPARSDPDCCFTRARSVSVTIFPARRCAVVFCTRYIDLLWNFASLYNYLLKLLFIGASLTIVYFMRYGPSQKATYNADEDAFPVQCAAAAQRPQLSPHFLRRRRLHVSSPPPAQRRCCLLPQVPDRAVRRPRRPHQPGPLVSV